MGEKEKMLAIINVFKGHLSQGHGRLGLGNRFNDHFSLFPQCYQKVLPYGPQNLKVCGKG